MKNRILTFIGISALIVAAVIFAAAQDGPGQQRQPPPPPPPPMGVPPIEHLAKILGLTDAQSAELKPFLDSERQTVDAIMKRLGDLHKQLDEATKDGHFDEAQVRGLATQMAQAQADLMVEHERMKAKIYNMLTPEQRARMEELHKRGGPHDGRPGPPNGPPPPPPPPQDN
jgi:Spy/CpxP family protein refolding chaperone